MSDQSDTSSAASAKTPIEAAVETFIYAPIGLLFEGASLLPELIEKGRNQVNMARMIGKFAVDQAGGEATKAAGKLQDQAAGLLDFIGGGITPAPADPEPAPAPKRPSAPRPDAGAARAAARKIAGAAGTAASTAATNAVSTAAATVEAAVGAASSAAAQAIDAASLAIPDYDGLSASHVVNRLAGLSPVELESVRLYELANRGRKTILSKVAQLQSS